LPMSENGPPNEVLQINAGIKSVIFFNFYVIRNLLNKNLFITNLSFSIITIRKLTRYEPNYKI
jgi:hypothetical protein